MSDIFSPGYKYKKFEVIQVFDVPDYHSKAVHLRHTVTGLEVIHLLNADEENLFAFAFRTPNEKANGAAHIIEHSVLCGSENFPLKDPFVNLANQSVKTYLNAMTYPDKTIYPASSIARKDYFNLMHVYGDAVFFPRLQEEIFMQEAHRLEADKSGKVTIQGVVYNEMKGSYSSFDSVVNDSIAISLLQNTVYQKDSGGDPAEIPLLTYEEFKVFHKKWYRPDNCLVFFYGNIPTQEQLDFLQEKFVDRLEVKFKDYNPSVNNSENNVRDFLKYVTADSLKKGETFKYEGPAGDSENESTVLVSWDLGNVKDSAEMSENVILAGILANHDGSPLQKALVESGLGEDIAPQSGFSASFYNHIFTMGLRGVKKSDAPKIDRLVNDTLKKIVTDGVSKKDLEAIMMGLELSQREIKRGSGPFSIAIMTKIVSGWLYGYDLSRQIRSRKDIDEIKEKINKIPGYLEEKIQKKFLDNCARALIIVSPSKKFLKNRDKNEKKLIKKLLRTTSIENIRAENEKLHKFQELSEDVTCLPHLLPSDFIKDGKPFMNSSVLKIEDIKGNNGTVLPYLISEENTNGIIYFDLGMPVDVLDCEDYPLLPLFSDCVTECGWKDLDWAKAAEETALHCGGIGAFLLTMDKSETENARNFCSKYSWTGRDWLIYRMYMLEEKAESALNLLSDCISGSNFSDLKRLRNLINETKNDFESSIVPDGHIYASSRVCSSNSKKSAVDEIWNGLTQFSCLKKIDKKSDQEISEAFQRIFKELKDGGAFIHVTAEKEGVNSISSLLPEFISKTALKELKDGKVTELKDFARVINNEFDADDAHNNEVFIVESQVGYAARTIPGSAYGTRDCAVDEICAHWLTNNILWEKIRTIGGAYGSFCNPEAFSQLIVFATYRDPSSLESGDVFLDCIEKCAEMDFSQEEIEKTVMGCYSHFIQPQTPKGRGATALTRALYGITDSDREQKIKWLLEVTNSDVKAAFKRMAQQIKNPEFSKKIRSCVICGKKSLESAVKSGKNCGKITNLPL